MSIHFISGKPGGGKTMYAVRLIAEELVQGDRIVVTNVALRLDVLNAYLQEHYPRAYERRMCSGDSAGCRHITDRVVVLGDEDLPHFFTYRADLVRVKRVTKDEWKAGVRPDFSVVRDSGVFYVLDEVHIAFNSRAWAATGAEVLYYLSQHRKLGDDVICITQAVNNVDKQFRSVAQDFTYVKNLRKQRVGLFRLPALFLRHTYLSPVVAGGTGAEHPVETGTFRLDVSGLAACYDTAKGVGIHGRAGADMSERKKGLHWAWFAVGFPVACWLFLHFLPLVAGHVLAPAGGAVSSAVAKALPPRPVAPDPAPGAVVVAAAPVVSVPAPVVSVPAPVVSVPAPVVSVPSAFEATNLFCRGYFPDGRNFVVFLSDGSTVNTSSGRVQELSRGYVVVDHQRLYVKRAESYLPAGFSAPRELTVPLEPAEPAYRPAFGGVVVTPSVGGSSR